MLPVNVCEAPYIPHPSSATKGMAEPGLIRSLAETYYLTRDPFLATQPLLAEQGIREGWIGRASVDMVLLAASPSPYCLVLTQGRASEVFAAR